VRTTKEGAVPYNYKNVRPDWEIAFPTCLCWWSSGQQLNN